MLEYLELKVDRLLYFESVPIRRENQLAEKQVMLELSSATMAKEH